MKIPKFLKKKKPVRRPMVTSIPSRIGDDGYEVVDMDGVTCYVHDLVAEAFVPNPEGKKYVIHKDGDKLNNHASNLAWSDTKE